MVISILTDGKTDAYYASCQADRGSSLKLAKSVLSLCIKTLMPGRNAFRGKFGGLEIAPASFNSVVYAKDSMNFNYWFISRCAVHF